MLILYERFLSVYLLVVCVCVPVPTAHLLHAEFLFLRCEIDEFKQVTHEKAKKKTYTAMHKLNFRFLLCFVRFDLNQIAHNQIL